MKKIKLLAATILSTMISYNVAECNQVLNNATEEEMALAIASVLKKNPEIAYNAVMDFRKQKDEIEKKKEQKLTELEEKIKDVIVNNPSLIVGALQIYEDKKYQEELIKQAEEYNKYIDEINSDEIYVGKKDGKYTLVEFFDFSCGYCKQLAPRLHRLLENNPELKIVFKPIAFLSQNSEVAAKGAIAASKQGKFMEMYLKLMVEPHLEQEKVFEIARGIELNIDIFKKDFEASETLELLNKTRQTADKINIKSVPTLVLNGMPLYANTDEQLQKAIDILKNQNK